MELTLVNTLGEPHGFTVPGMVEPIVVEAGKTAVVSVTASKAGAFAFSCQLHPAHVGGKITVE